MSTFIYEDMDPAERLKVLQKTAIRKETMEFSRTLSETDLVIEKDLYCRDGMRIASLKSELEMAQANYKGQIKAIEAVQADRLTVIASEKRGIFDEVYLILDTAQGRVNYYDKRGELVHSRNMNDEERQGRLFLGVAQEPAPAGPNAGVTVADDHVEDIPHEEVKPEEKPAPGDDETKDQPKKRGPRKKKEDDK